MTEQSSTISKVWRSAQLFIGFHRDQNGIKREVAKVWSPKNASATIHSDPTEQEAFVVVKGANENDPKDVQIKLRQDKIVLRRDPGIGWDGVIADEYDLTISVAGVTIKVKSDGSVVREAADGRTFIEADGKVIKQTQDVDAIMSGDGVELSRRTDTTFAAIRHDGVIAKARDPEQISPQSEAPRLSS